MYGHDGVGPAPSLCSYTVHIPVAVGGELGAGVVPMAETASFE